MFQQVSRIVTVAFLLLAVSACSLRYPPPAQFQGNRIPIDVAIDFEQNRVAYEEGRDANESVGPAVAQLLKVWTLFRSAEYPPSGSRDTTLLLSVVGGLDRQEGSNRVKTLAVAVSLFLLSPFLDRTAEFSHTIDAKILHRGNFIGQYSIPPVVTEVRRTHGPSSKPINDWDLEAAQRAHESRLAAALAEVISKDKDHILRGLGH